MENKIYYISGKMSGMPDNNYPKFNHVAKLLRDAGIEVLNPAENPDPVPVTWQGYMRMALEQMSRCNTVMMLDGWSESKGAKVEYWLAKGMGYEVLFESNYAFDEQRYAIIDKMKELANDLY